MTNGRRSAPNGPSLTARLAAACKTAALALLRSSRRLAPAQSKAPATASDSQAPVLDLDVFQELCFSLGNQPEAAKAIYVKFLHSSAAHLDTLKAQPQEATRAKTLHALKGSAAMVGANRIAALAARFHDARPEPADALPDRAPFELERELADFRRVLDAQFQSLG